MSSDWNLPDGQFGPALRGGHGRGPDWRRLLRIVGATLGLVGIVGAAATGALLWYGQRNLDRVEVAGRADPDAQPIKEVLNVLLVGSDSREGLTRDQLKRLGTDNHGGNLTDTIMLLHLNPNREQVVLLSFPRDLLVTRCDGSRGRINAAYAIGVKEGTGGPSCVVRTVADLTNIPVHHYVELDFAGFIKVVDTLGGVRMYFSEPLKDISAGLDVPAGCVQLDGVRALGFVRARKNLDNDFGRIARQQRFIGELIDKVTSAGVLLNLPRLFALVDATASAVNVDDDLSPGDMRRVAASLRGLTRDGVDMRTVPAAGRRGGGPAYLYVREDEAEALFTAIRDGRALDDMGAMEQTELTPADVPPLVVLNGAGVAGLAGQAQQALEARGFSVEATGNAETVGRQNTSVYFPEERRAEAELLAVSLPGVELVAEEYTGGQDVDTAGPITLVLGASFDPDDLPSPEPTPARTGAPAAGPTPTFAGATPSARTC